MKVMYNFTGNRRKELVKAVGVLPRYMGAPSFAFAVGSYEIDRDGTLAAPVGHDSDAFDRLLGQLWLKGFQHGERVDDPAEPVDPEGVMAQPAAAPKSIAVEPPTTSTGEQPFLTISMPLEGFTDAKLLNLERLIASKASLIQKALGAARLTVERLEDKLAFAWFDRELDSFEIQTYAHFIEALCDAAKRQQRVSATERAVDSEKFAFRIFLLRLGFGGSEYAAERKLLLRNLSGPSAFPNAAKAAQHTDRWRERREQQRATLLPNPSNEYDAL